jgi:hypothetical protein
LRYTLLLIFFTTSSYVFAQKINSAYQIRIAKANGPIQIDGNTDEAAWAEAEPAKDFFMVSPMDTSYARVLTEVRMTYDDANLYISAICYQPNAKSYAVESLRRDFAYNKNDNFLLIIDPFDDQTNGFTFGVNAAGAQWDGLIFNSNGYDLSWDNKWYSEVKHYDDRWVFEAAIPFKSIRYKKGIKTWGINFSRLDIKVPEKSAWAKIPRQFNVASLAYTGNLLWDQAPPETGTNVSVIPYVLGGFTRDHESNSRAKFRKEMGADAKIGITSSLNLDLTVNPDFSQIEVDKQVTNLDRFELFFPERRQFFLENADLFANFGYSTIRPFFSRRIGLGVPIEYGVRLSGSLDKHWRIGVMDMQTKSIEKTGLPAQNFAVLALQRRVFSRSNIRFMFVNKQSVNYHPENQPGKPDFSLSNRNVGVEYNMVSKNNLWVGKTMMLKSFSPQKKSDDLVHAANLQYTNRKWILSWQQEVVGENYNAEVGYVPRTDFIRLNPKAGYLFFPKAGNILNHGPVLSSSYYFTKSFNKSDNETILSYKFTHRNQSTMEAWASNNFIRLLKPFDPVNTGKGNLGIGTEHFWTSWGLNYASKPQKEYTYIFSGQYGGYYADGQRLNLAADLGYRFQPYVNMALSTSYNHIVLPQPWRTTDFWLIGPRTDITFSNKLFFTTFVQYNNQQKNINLNTRFQWRYKPASDLFLVYTDNYYSSPFAVRNRALVLKFTYWWN